jgi:hypothetical protein
MMKTALGMVMAAGLCVSIAGEAKAANWTSVDPMLQPAQNVATCQIANNRILVAGGDDSATGGSTVFDTWTLYDTAGNVISTSASTIQPMPAPRTQGKMVRIPTDDKCLYIGGASTTTGTAEQEVFQFDLSAGVWTNLTGLALNDARFEFEVLPYSSSKFAVFGGRSSSTGYIDTIEVVTFGGASVLLEDALTNPVLLSQPRAGFSLVAQGTDYYVIGGNDNNGTFEEVDRISISTSGPNEVGSFAAREALDVACIERTNAVAFPVSVAVANVAYEILLTGGEDSGASALNETCLYDIQNDDWILNSARDLQNPSTKLKALAMGGGDFIVVGGEDGATSVTASQRWTVGTSDWEKVALVPVVHDLLEGRVNFGIELGGTKALVFGGFDLSGPTVLDTAEVSP